jgi:uncharacterized protein
MNLGPDLAIGAAGFGAGVINAIAGAGSLLTFPVLVALGLPPVTANVSNTIGLVPGGLAGAWGFRRELRGQGSALRRLVPCTVAGAVVGAWLLLRLPAAAFTVVVPVLLLLSVALIGLQPQISQWVARRNNRAAGGSDRNLAPAATFAAGVYGGYFGAAQGVLLLGVLGSLLPAAMHRVNALKNVLATCANAVAAMLFMVFAADRVSWPTVFEIAACSIGGGLAGARIGRWLSPQVLRFTIMGLGVIGCAIIVLG